MAIFGKKFQLTDIVAVKHVNCRVESPPQRKMCNGSNIIFMECWRDDFVELISTVWGITRSSVKYVHTISDQVIACDTVYK